jgi:hypothetical protein
MRTKVDIYAYIYIFVIIIYDLVRTTKFVFKAERLEI